MFGFSGNKKNVNSVELFQAEYFELLNSIHEKLLLSNHLEQAKFVNELICLITKSKYESFCNQINSVKMWGGAGAVWEVDIGDREIQNKFMIEIIDLINLLEKNGVLGNGINPIRKLFKKEIRM